MTSTGKSKQKTLRPFTESSDLFQKAAIRERRQLDLELASIELEREKRMQKRMAEFRATLIFFNGIRVISTPPLDQLRLPSAKLGPDEPVIRYQLPLPHKEKG